MRTNLYIKKFIKDKNVGAISSTSGYTVKKLFEKIHFENAEIIVEFGPGNGVITRGLLQNMQPQSKLYIFETNADFIEELSKIKDSRLYIINEDAQNAKSVLEDQYQIDAVDYIVSTIPFSLMDIKKRICIIRDSFSLLKDKGRFVTYQYSLSLFNLLNKHFNETNYKINLLAFSTAFIMCGTKSCSLSNEKNKEHFPN